MSYIYGFTFDKEGKRKSTFDILRYSAWQLWVKNKAQYRLRYYEGKSFHNSETLFGTEVHQMLQDPKIAKKHPILSQVLRYSKTEHNIETRVGDVKVAGCLDSFDPETFSFLDYKNSHLSREGKAPWDAVKVSRHDQLPFYSMLIKQKYGSVNPACHLIWLETRFQNKSVDFEGHTLTTSSRELELTGRVETFKRRIFNWERELMIELVHKAAKEISEDFIQYQEAHE